MTRDEVLSEILETVSVRFENGMNTHVRVRKHLKEADTLCENGYSIQKFKWQEPRRIPPEGTPVMWQPDGMGNHVGICTGESSPCGRPVVKMPHLKSSEETWACENWIELVEATP